MFLTYKKIIVEIKFRKYCVNSLVARVHLLNERTKSLFCLLVLKTILLVRFLEEFEDTKKSFRNQWMTDYSRVHISSDSLFSKILKKPSIVQKKWYLLWTSLVSFIAKEQKNNFWTTLIPKTRKPGLYISIENLYYSQAQS